MKKILLIILAFSSLNSFGQDSYETYRELRQCALLALKNENFIKAFDCIEGASGCNVNSTEVNKLYNMLHVKMDSIYNMAIKLFEKSDYENAFLNFQKLDGIRMFESTKLLLSYEGLCYWRRNLFDLAKDKFLKGINIGDSYSSLYLANMCKQNHIAFNFGHSEISLYSTAANFKIDEAIDSLGIIYTRNKNYSTAIKWFEKSNSSFAAYQYACILIDGNVESQNRDFLAISLLKKASDNNYLPSMYYLGLIYVTGSHGVKINDKEGWRLIDAAAAQGYYPAKVRQKNRNRTTIKYY